MGRVTLVKLVQCPNAYISMVVREFGNVTLVKLVQCPNAYISMVVREFGNVTLVKLVLECKILWL